MTATGPHDGSTNEDAELPTRAFAWEIPVPAVRAVAAALAAGRPVALAAAAPRLNGLPDAEVTVRYGQFRKAVLIHAARIGAATEKFAHLEASEPGAHWTRWETWLMVNDAHDDAEVVALARRLWEALGPNEYARQLKGRPRTWRGFGEGRNWAVAGTLGPVLIVIAGQEIDRVTGVPWWTSIPIAAGWVALVGWLFLRRYRRLERIGGAELPYL